eukprot:6497144-Pyramimonas_sp.AAC.1
MSSRGSFGNAIGADCALGAGSGPPGVSLGAPLGYLGSAASKADSVGANLAYRVSLEGSGATWDHFGAVLRPLACASAAVWAIPSYLAPTWRPSWSL